MSRTCTRQTVFELTSRFFSSRNTTLSETAFRSTMAWGLEARVPFLDKSFLEVAMNVDPKEKMFHKGASQAVDEDGCPKMEKVQNLYFSNFSTKR